MADKARKIQLVIDGKPIDVQVENQRTEELNAALRDPEQFRLFAKDPKAFVAKFGMQIDKEVSDQLAKKLVGKSDLSKLSSGAEMPQATIWAVAEGIYSVSSSKVAVAF